MIDWRRKSATRWASAGLLSLLALAVSPASARDRGADGRFEKRVSSHFVLYQDVDIDESGGLRGSRRFEQQVLGELEDAYDLLDRLLDLRPPQKLDVVVYDAGVFDGTFAGRFRFRSAGFYSGVIRVRGESVVSTQLARTLHHELVHAALDAAAPSLILPAWMNEGLAEWFEARAVSKRYLSRYELGTLQRASAQGALLSIDALSTPSFARLGQETATLAYLQSYGMIEYLSRTFGEQTLGQLIEAVIRERDVERALRRTYSMGLYDLEARFTAELS